MATFAHHQADVLANWKGHMLNECWIVEFHTGPYLRALSWTHPTHQLHPGSVMIHACAEPSARGRWLTRRNLAAVFEPAHRLGANRVYAQVTNRLVERIWLSLGFTIYHDEKDDVRLAYKDGEQWVELESS